MAAFPPPQRNALIDLQLLILDTTAPAGRIEQSLLSSRWLDHPDDLVTAFVIAANCRPTQIPALASLLASLGQSATRLKSVLLSFLFRSFRCVRPFPHESANFSLLFECYSLGLFTLDDLVPPLRHLAADRRFMRSTCWLFCYLGPDLESGLQEELSLKLREAVNGRSFPHIFKKFTRLAQESWNDLRARRGSSQLISVLQTDDVITLRLLATSPLFSVDARIQPTAFTPISFLQGHPTLIQAAALFGSRKCFDLLSGLSADMNAIDCEGRTLSEFSGAGGDVEIIRKCQQQSLDMSRAASAAIQFHRNDVAAWLCGCDLHAACQSGNLEFLRVAWDVNGTNQEGQRPLHIAVRRGFVVCVRELLSCGRVDVNAVLPSGVSALHLAARHGDVDIARMLIEHGADVCGQTASGSSPLLIAAANGQYDIVRLLLDCDSIDINAVNRDGQTALMVAALSNYADIVECLVGDARTDVKVDLRLIKDRRIFEILMSRSTSGTLLHWLIRKGCEDFAELTLGHGNVDVNAVDAGHNTPIHVACMFGSMRMVRALLRFRGIDVNAVNANGNRPLHVGLKFPKIARELIVRPDVDINAADGSGWAPIHRLVFNNELELVEAMSRRTDFDVNVRLKGNIHSWTPLMLAASRGNRDMVTALLEVPEIDVKATCDGFKTAYAIAIANRHRDCAKLLKRRSAKRCLGLAKVIGKWKRRKRPARGE
jgi:ankyrin repeat protein